VAEASIYQICMAIAHRDAAQSNPQKRATSVQETRQRLGMHLDIG